MSPSATSIRTILLSAMMQRSVGCMNSVPRGRLADHRRENGMLYGVYQGMVDALEPLRLAARMTLSMKDAIGPIADMPVMRSGFALADMIADTKFTHARPGYAIESVASGNIQAGCARRWWRACRSATCCTSPRTGSRRHSPKCWWWRRSPAITLPCCVRRYAPCCAITTSTSPTGRMRATCRWPTGASVSTIIVDYIIRFLETLGPRRTCSPCASPACRPWRRWR